jgi:hypothetical protein
MAHCDAAGVNGSNRIFSHGAPLSRMMPNGCLGSPVIVLLFGLDRGFLMDVGPKHKDRAEHGPSSTMIPSEMRTSRECKMKVGRLTTKAKVRLRSHQ